MKKYQEVYIVLALLTVILSSGISTAYANSSEYEEYRKGKTTISERREAMLATFENNDYQKWLKVVGGDNPLVKLISQEEFNKFVSARNLARAGEYDKSLEIGREVGLEIEKSLWQKTEVPKITRLTGSNQASLISINPMAKESVWLELAANFSKVSKKLTEENFYLLAKVQELKQKGQFDEARAIEKELGIA